MIIYDIKKGIKCNDKTGITEMIGKKAELGSYERLSITKVTIDQFYTDKKHYHKCSDELYYVIKGSCALMINDTYYLLEEGKCILIEHGEQHYVKGLGNLAELIVICSPAWDENDCYYV